MEGPSQGLGPSIGHIDDTRDVMHLNTPALAALLNCKMLIVNMVRLLSRLAFIDHGNSSLVVLIEDG